ncbi:MAG: TonB-dependent receptor [Dysgonamonadaceae bacterium]|jgi:TonB-linked SusC/RagA family outer membrane protein|nr:TonB-dependent receptor [Dysgonamonadaceae bacterium]
MKKKFNAIIICLFGFSVAVPTLTAANLQQITLHLENVSLETALSELERVGNVEISYSKEVILGQRKVSINKKDANVNEILVALLKETGVTWEIVDNKIYLTGREANVAEGIPVKGIIVNENGDPVVGASIYSRTEKKRTVSDLTGAFSIEVEEGSMLDVTYMGYADTSVKATSGATLRIVLKETVKSLDDVVVIGYGTVKKRDLTGSVASVKGDIMNSFAKVNVQSALQGRAAGVEVKQGSGMPGSTIQIRIRGTNSIKGGNEPLYIIDGFPGQISTLNVADVESIEVLKDASASAIYGSRAANGVVLITTKQAKQGKMNVEYNGSIGFASQIKKLDLMTGSEYLQFMNEQQKIATGNDFYTTEQIAAAGKGTDWQDLVFRTAQVNNHSINISGGNEMMLGLLGVSYYDQEGIIPANEIKKMSIRAQVSMNLSKKLTVSGKLLYMFTDWDRNDSSGTNRLASVIGSILGAPATITPYDENGNYSLMRTDFLTGGLNPIAYINEVTRKQLNYGFVSNAAIDYKPISDLTIRLSGNANVMDTRNEYYTSTAYPGSMGSATLGFPQTVDLNSTNTVTYDKTFVQAHHVTAMAGMTYDQSVSKSASMSAEQFQSDAGGVFNIGAGAKQNVPSSSYSKWTILSFFGRLNYACNSKYMATFNMRADGSSRYSKGGKWGYFPSTALAWRVSEESFMERSTDFLSDLKLRVSYGVTGNTGVSPYQTLDLITSGTIVLNKDLTPYYRMSDTYQSNLKWETTTQLDLGVDFSLFDNRVRVTADYYMKKTKDLLNTVEMPRSSGYTTSTQNIGRMENKGFEVWFDADILKGLLEWNVTANASFNKNKVTELYQGKDMNGAQQDIVIMKDFVHLIRVGEPLGVFYGFVDDGYDDQGRVLYKDVDGDGSITTFDREIIGTPHPDCTLGFTSSWKYKNFQLSCFLYASLGADIYSLSMAALTHDYQWGISTMREVLYDHWTPDNPNATYPNITAAASGNLRMSNRFVYDASYLRMKNFELAYNLPESLLGMRKAQVYVSAQNLFTVTKYPFWDVEVNAQGGSSAIEQGIDAYNYPGNKSYTMGVRIVF